MTHWTHELHKQHPARTMDFDELYGGLMKRVGDGLISCNEDFGGLEIFTYTPECAHDKIWDVYTAISRGLILHPESKTVVATPFPKFWNYGELEIPMPDEDFTVFEKNDGSLGICFHWRGYWYVATKGSFRSDQALWATNWLNDHPYVTMKMEPGYTYLFEIIYPENRIVVDYKEFSGLVLLECYDNNGFKLEQGGTKAHRENINLTDLAVHLGVGNALYWHHFEDLDAVKNHFDSLDYNHEGGVVRFDSGFLTKIKGKDYLRMHRIISHCSPLNIWRMMVAGDNLDEFRKEIPEEFRADYDLIRELLEKKYQDNVDLLSYWHDITSYLSDKSVGLLLQTMKSPDSDVVKSFLFRCRKNDFLNVLNESDVSKLDEKELYSRGQFMKIFRPVGNKLEGYSATMMLGMFDN